MSKLLLTASLVPILVAGLAQRPGSWQVLRPLAIQSKNGATLTVLADDSVRVSGTNPQRDVYTAEFTARLRDLHEIRIEAIKDGPVGPGRTPHGNFVVSEVELWLLPHGGRPHRIALRNPVADYSQPGYPAKATVDGKPQTGWAIHGPVPNWRRTRTLKLTSGERFASGAGTRFRLVIRQEWGCQSNLRRFRVSVRGPGRKRRPKKR